MGLGVMRWFRPGFWIAGPVMGALAGVLYAVVFDTGLLAVSAVRGIFIGAPILFYERGLLMPRWRARVRRAATQLFAAATVATYVAMIVLGNAAAGTLLHRLFGYRCASEAARLQV